jgi:hypothetical protein
VFFLHHPTKKDKSGRGRGSSALYYAADTELSVVLEGKEHTDGTKIVTLTVVKQKDDAKVSISLKNRIVPVLDDCGRPLAHLSGRAITSCILEEASEAEVKEARQQAARTTAGTSVETDVREYVRQHPGQTCNEIRIGTGKGKSTVREALDALMSQRLILAVKAGRRMEYVAVPVSEPEL